MIIKNRQLTSKQLNDLSQLTSICKNIDNGLPVIYYPLLQKLRNTNSNVFYYDQQNLVGFLSMYHFYERGCELTLLVAPTKRRQGIARHLITELIPLFDKLAIDKLIFSISHYSESSWLADKGLQYDYSDYNMQLSRTEPISRQCWSLTVTRACRSDLAILYAIDEQCFPEQQEGSPERFTELLNEVILV